MEPDMIFNLGNIIAIPFWVLHFLAPYSRLSLFAATWKIGPLILALLYTSCILPGISEIFEVLVPADFEVIVQLFGTPEGAAIAWLHFLAFDLFVAETFLLKDPSYRLSAFSIRLILIPTLFVAPIGFLIFWIATVFKRQRTLANHQVN
jgi:hypothetical protein